MPGGPGQDGEEGRAERRGRRSRVLARLATLLLLTRGDDGNDDGGWWGHEGWHCSVGKPGSQRSLAHITWIGRSAPRPRAAAPVFAPPACPPLVNIGAGLGWSHTMAAGARRCAAVDWWRSGRVAVWYSCGDSGRGILLHEAAELGPGGSAGKAGVVRAPVPLLGALIWDF